MHLFSWHNIKQHSAWSLHWKPWEIKTVKMWQNKQCYKIHNWLRTGILLSGVRHGPWAIVAGSICIINAQIMINLKISNIFMVIGDKFDRTDLAMSGEECVRAASTIKQFNCLNTRRSNLYTRWSWFSTKERSCSATKYSPNQNHGCKWRM